MKVEIINGKTYINGKLVKDNEKANKEVEKDNNISDSIINFGTMTNNGKKIPRGIHKNKKRSWWG